MLIVGMTKINANKTKFDVVKHYQNQNYKKKFQLYVVV